MGFRVGDIVRRKDGDGRPHKIVDISPEFPLYGHGSIFFKFTYEDGDCDYGDYQLEYYKGDYKPYKL